MFFFLMLQLLGKKIRFEKLVVLETVEKFSKFELLRKIWNYIWKVLGSKLGQASCYIQ